MPRRTLLKPDEIEQIFQRLHAIEPEPKGELNYGNAYQLLLAVALSAQATDVSVNKATEALFQIVETPQDLLDLGEAGLIQHIKTIGLFNSKAKNALAAAAMLVERHDGEVPEDRAALEALPGVGRKTANVVLQMYFGHPTIAVDTHVFRVSNRLGLAPGKNPDQVEAKLMKRVPAKWQFHAHHWLILHGRYTCLARKPKCAECGLADLCLYPDKTP